MISPSVSATYVSAYNEQYSVPFREVTVSPIIETKEITEKVDMEGWVLCRPKTVPSSARKGFNKVFQLPWTISFSTNVLQEIKKIASSIIPFLGPFIAVNQTWDKFSEAVEHFKGISALKKERIQLIKQEREEFGRGLKNLGETLALQQAVAADPTKLQAKIQERESELQTAIVRRREQLTRDLDVARGETTAAQQEIELSFQQQQREARQVFNQSQEAQNIRNTYDLLLQKERKNIDTRAYELYFTIGRFIAPILWETAVERATQEFQPNIDRLQKAQQERLEESYQKNYFQRLVSQKENKIQTEHNKLINVKKSLEDACNADVEKMKAVAAQDNEEIRNPQLLFNRKKEDLEKNRNKNIRKIAKTFHKALQLRRVMAFNKTIRCIGELGWTAALIALTAAAILQMFYLTNSRPDSLALLPKKIAILGSYVLGASFGVIFLNELAWTYVFKENFMKKLPEPTT